MKTALFIIDVQNDFVEGGALAVRGGKALAERISAFVEDQGWRFDYVIASRDWHDSDSDNGGHFHAEPDFEDTWPTHCVRSTHGAEYHEAISPGHIDIHVFKGQGRPAYSIFQGFTGDDEPVPGVLDRLGVTHVTVVGIATDHCVRASAMDALQSGREVQVLIDLVEGVSTPASVVALSDLADRGAMITLSERSRW